MKLFIECMKRLYMSNNISKEKIEELFLNGKLSKEDKEYILEAH